MEDSVRRFSLMVASMLVVAACGDNASTTTTAPETSTTNPVVATTSAPTTTAATTTTSTTLDLRAICLASRDAFLDIMGRSIPIVEELGATAMNSGNQVITYEEAADQFFLQSLEWEALLAESLAVDQVPETEESIGLWIRIVERYLEATQLASRASRAVDADVLLEARTLTAEANILLDGVVDALVACP